MYSVTLRNTLNAPMFVLESQEPITFVDALNAAAEQKVQLISLLIQDVIVEDFDFSKLNIIKLHLGNTTNQDLTVLRNCKINADQIPMMLMGTDRTRPLPRLDGCIIEGDLQNWLAHDVDVSKCVLTPGKCWVGKIPLDGDMFGRQFSYLVTVKKKTSITLSEDILRTDLFVGEDEEHIFRLTHSVLGITIDDAFFSIQDIRSAWINGSEGFAEEFIVEHADDLLKIHNDFLTGQLLSPTESIENPSN